MWWTTSPGSATAGSDYTTTNGTLTFAPGETSKNISIPILDDPTVEPNETLTLTLSSPTNATLGTPNPATLTILDDETVQPYDETYTYNKLGNLTSKTGKGSYSYPATGSAHPHAVTSTSDGQTYVYDANGNMTGTGGLISLYDAENRPTHLSRVSGTEDYSYDADGERVTRTYGFTTTVYLGGLWEEDVVGGASVGTRSLYSLNGVVVAQRDAMGVVYLHGDHLGSISVATGTGGVKLSSQEFDPWGKVRPGSSIGQTALNYTGQRLDTTGLLYYHARYYDPNLARFVSPDTQAPEPANPQDLNPYSYVHNNPIRYADPSGHCIPGINGCQVTGTPNWHDLGQYALGLGEGALSAVQGAAETAQLATPLGFMQLGTEIASDPAGYAAAQANAVNSTVHNAILGASHPLIGAEALLDDPRATGQALGALETNLAIAKGVGDLLGICSFSADTPVATPDGEQAIGSLQVGDHVLAYDPATGRTDSYTVTAVLVHSDPLIEYLTIDGERLETTPEHPFLTRERGWVAAGDLRSGDHVRQLGGRNGVVWTVVVEQRSQVMYNLTVAVAHTFFVGDGQWLVHNICGADLASRANDALRSLPAELRRATVGAAEKADGGIIYSVYHRTLEGTQNAVGALRAQGLDVLDAPSMRGATYHAERQLAAKGYTDIDYRTENLF